MSNHIRIAAVAKVSAKLEALMDRLTPTADDNPSLAYHTLCHGVLDALQALDDVGGRTTNQDMEDARCALRMEALREQLVAQLPAISGGSPDGDHEVIDPEFLEDPAGWPAYPHAELDGYRYETGPTPLDVLAHDDFEAERSDADWDAWAALCVEGVSEADHLVLHGCC